MLTQIHPLTRLRSSLANVAWVIEDRVILGAADLLRAFVDIVKWPFERAAWAVEQWLIWPLEERAGAWGRRAGIAFVGALAIAAGVAGLLWAAPGNGGDSASSRSAAPAELPILTQPPQAKAPAAVLQGAAPVFEPEADGGVSRVAGSEAVPSQTAAAGSGASKPTEAPAALTAPGGPAAMKVARRFADAFVLYETGQANAEVREGLRETATPHLARSLLSRPPRLPANTDVPQAKVLNVVAGPRRGGTLTVSASLLRVGVTSELRIDLQKTKDGPKVTSVLG